MTKIPRKYPTKGFFCPFFAFALGPLMIFGASATCKKQGWGGGQIIKRKLSMKSKSFSCPLDLFGGPDQRRRGRGEGFLGGF